MTRLCCISDRSLDGETWVDGGLMEFEVRGAESSPNVAGSSDTSDLE